MYIFDSTRIDLALEFYQQPYGRHSADLQYLLCFMREPRDEPHYVLIETIPQKEWVLSKMPHGAGELPTLSANYFSKIEDAEWYVFKLRWYELGGESLDHIN